MLHHRPTAYAQAAAAAVPTVLSLSAYSFNIREGPMNLTPASSAGNSLVFMQTNGLSGTISGVGDNIDGAAGWNLAFRDSSDGGQIEVFYKNNCPAGIDTITWTQSGSTSGLLQAVHETTGPIAFSGQEYWYSEGYQRTVHHSESGVTGPAGIYFAVLRGSGAHNGFTAISGDWTTRPEVAGAFDRWGQQDATLDPGPVADRFTCEATSARTYDAFWYSFVSE